MHRSSITVIIAGLLFLAAFTAGCSGQDATLPTLVPRSEADPISGDAGPDESPREGEAASGIPPTWTPQPQQELATPLPQPDTGGSSSEPAGDSEDSYVVQPGDTLAEIAQEFGVDLERLAQVNDIVDIDRIEVGQVLVIPR